MKYIDPYSISDDVYSCVVKRSISKIYIYIGLLLCALVVPQVMAENTSTATRETKATAVNADIGPGEETKPLQEMAAEDSILDRLAAQNAELTRTLKEQAAELDQMPEQREQAEKLQKRIKSDLNDLQDALKAYGRTEGFGSLLLRQRESLPDRRVYVRRARERERKFEALGVRQLDHKDEARRLADLDQAVATFDARMPADKVKQLQGPLVKLVEERQLLLGEIMAADEFYLAELNKLEAAEQNLLDAAQLCDEFLAENLLWFRSRASTTTHSPCICAHIWMPSTNASSPRRIFTRPSIASSESPALSSPSRRGTSISTSASRCPSAQIIRKRMSPSREKGT